MNDLNNMVIDLKEKQLENKLFFVVEGIDEFF